MNVIAHPSLIAKYRYILIRSSVVNLNLKSVESGCVCML